MSTTRNILGPAARGLGGLAAAVLVLAAFCLLLPLQGSGGGWRVYVTGVGSIVALASALWLKYRGRWELNAEIIFLAGISLQYLISPTLLQFLSQEVLHLDLVLSAERLEARESYPGAMLMVLAFIGTFLLTSHFIAERSVEREEGGRCRAVFPVASLILILSLAVVLWVDRFFLLRTGSFYQLDRSEFQFDDWRYSIMAQVDYTLGIVVAAFLTARVLLVRQAMVVPVLLYLLVDCAWNFASGSRERALVSVLCQLLVFVVARRRLPMKWILPGVVAAVFLIGFMDYYRYAVLESGEASRLELGRVSRAMGEAREQSELVGLERTLIAGLSRLNDLDSIAAIHGWVPSALDHLGGETYWSILSVFVPRFIWTEKPPLIMPINTWFFVREGGSSPTTVMGEGYLNFGWGGVVLAGVVSALLLRGTERFLLRHSGQGVFVPVYVLFLLAMSRLHTQPLGIWVGTVLKLCAIMWALQFVTRLFQRLVDRRTAEPGVEAEPDLGAALGPPAGPSPGPLLEPDGPAALPVLPKLRTRRL